MRITFVSNYINHHQIPFSDACYKELAGEYFFIQTEPMEAERLNMGWEVDTGSLPYVHFSYKDEAYSRKLVLESDIVIFGWTKREDLVEARLQTGKVTLRVSERLYREGQWKAVSPRGLIKKYHDHTRYRNCEVYLLCAGAYVASDYHLVKSYPDKMLRFGYFPESKRYGSEELFSMKEKDGKVHLIWAGRFLPLKHPEYAVRLAGELKREGADFHLHMAGGGELETELKQLAANEGVMGNITFYGFRKPSEIRALMENAHIFLFTSNHLEGWGAVLNEGMNSGCGVVASVQAGAVPYLIVHETNGLVYQDSAYDAFSAQAKRLVYDSEMTKRLGAEAYQTIAGMWNAGHAAKELIRMCGCLLEGRFEPAKEGPLSIAPVIRPGSMYRYMTEHRI